MNLATEIKQIVEAAIPLDPSCAAERSKQLERRATLRLAIEELLRRERLQIVGPTVLK